MMSAVEIFPGFALLRPLWLLLLPLLLLAWFLPRRTSRQQGSAWEELIDPPLQPHVLQDSAAGTVHRRGSIRGLLLSFTLLAVLALSGPAVQQSDGSAQYVRPLRTRLILVDLSPRFAALSSLQQEKTRHKLQALLDVLPPAETALAVHAEAAYLVVPPTMDSLSLARWLPDLTADAMPVVRPRSGQSLDPYDEALQLAATVLSRSTGKNELLWFLAAPVEQDLLRASLHRHPLPSGTLLKILQNGEGELDLDAGTQWRSGGEINLAQWRDMGPWLLLFLLPLAARALFFSCLLAFSCLLVLTPQEVSAADVSRWQAVSHYRAGDFAAAAAVWEAFDDADSLYNRGNALARLGRLQDALKFYDAALQIKPTDLDYQHNRALLARLIKEPPAKKPPPPASPPKAPPPSKRPSAQAESEAQRIAEQWLRRVPDEPANERAGGSPPPSLLQRKLAIEAAQRLNKTALP